MKNERPGSEPGREEDDQYLGANSTNVVVGDANVGVEKHSQNAPDALGATRHRCKQCKSSSRHGAPGSVSAESHVGVHGIVMVVVMVVAISVPMQIGSTPSNMNCSCSAARSKP